VPLFGARSQNNPKKLFNASAENRPKPEKLSRVFFGGGGGLAVACSPEGSDFFLVFGRKVLFFPAK
jgi:Tfp pilus tip-associated adhesin PilY1